MHVSVKRGSCYNVNLSAETTCDVFGQKLRTQVEDRLKFYETGDIPAKNVDVMKEALVEAQAVLVSKEYWSEVEF